MSLLTLCLPKGNNLTSVASFLESVQFPINGYSKENRCYRPEVGISNVRAKMFNEKDIPIQVAIGNYTLGICKLEWAEEHWAKYPRSPLRLQKKLNTGFKKINVCCHRNQENCTLESLRNSQKPIRIVSEYPNLAEFYARKNRFSRYIVFPVGGNVATYLPEHGDLVLISISENHELETLELRTIDQPIFISQLCVFINRDHYETNDISPILQYFY